MIEHSRVLSFHVSALSRPSGILPLQEGISVALGPVIQKAWALGSAFKSSLNSATSFTAATVEQQTLATPITPSCVDPSTASTEEVQETLEDNMESLMNKRITKLSASYHILPQEAKLEDATWDTVDDMTGLACAPLSAPSTHFILTPSSGSCLCTGSRFLCRRVVDFWCTFSLPPVLTTPERRIIQATFFSADPLLRSSTLPRPLGAGARPPTV